MNNIELLLYSYGDWKRIARDKPTLEIEKPGHEGLKIIHRKLFKTEFNKDDKDFFANIVNPTRSDSVINKVPRVLSTFRDATIVDEIVKYWQQGKSIFTVFGGGHVIVQDRALKTLLH
ncbi:MAG: hypothetical protein AAB847_02095 [Patescibacteria group bacterium]